MTLLKLRAPVLEEPWGLIPLSNVLLDETCIERLSKVSGDEDAVVIQLIQSLTVRGRDAAALRRLQERWYWANVQLRAWEQRHARVHRVLFPPSGRTAGITQPQEDPVCLPPFA